MSGSQLLFLHRTPYCHTPVRRLVALIRHQFAARIPNTSWQEVADRTSRKCDQQFQRECELSSLTACLLFFERV